MKIRIFSLAIIVAVALTGCLNSDLTNTDDQLKGDLEAIDTYLDNQGILAYADANGLRFTLDSVGSGYPPKFGNTVTFKYTGKLLNGTVFEASTLSNVAIANLIVGLQIGLPLIPNGSKATFYIPSTYAYGSQAQDKIPANSNLIFEVFLKSIVITQTEKNQLGADTVRIDNFITKQNFTNVVKDTSGLRYIITEPGNGIKPSWLDKVKVIYTGYIINEDGTLGQKFYEGTSEPGTNSDSRVVNYIRGFQIGLQQIPEGSKAKLFIPSVMAFGSTQVTGGIVIVPPNSSLLYDVELVDVSAP